MRLRNVLCLHPPHGPSFPGGGPPPVSHGVPLEKIKPLAGRQLCHPYLETPQPEYQCVMTHRDVTGLGSTSHSRIVNRLKIRNVGLVVEQQKDRRGSGPDHVELGCLHPALGLVKRRGARWLQGGTSGKRVPRV